MHFDFELGSSQARLSNVATAAVYNSNGNRVVLAGGTTTIALWGQGNIYSGTSNTKSYNQGPLTPPSKPSVLLDSAGRVFGRGHPTVRPPMLHDL